MNCKDFDLKGYILEELDEAGRRHVAGHLEACARCREELERLRITQAALLSAADEEVPRRIAFLSDKVFEPSWWQRLWQSGPRLAFASVAILSVAIVVRAILLQPPASDAPLPLDTAAVERIVDTRIAENLQAAVESAVAAAEERHAQQTAALLEAAEKRFEMQCEADLIAVQENFEVLTKRMNVMHLASAYRGGER